MYITTTRFAGPGYMAAANYPPHTDFAHLRPKEFYAAGSTKLAAWWGYLLADNSRHARRPDERPWSRRPLRRRDAETLVDQQHDVDVRHVLDSAGRLGAVGLQDGLRHTGRRSCAYERLRKRRRF